jgi:putative ATP-binding cassette transporter
LRALCSQFRRLISVLVLAPGGKTNLALFALVVALNLGGVYATIRLVEWTGAFYSAIEKMDGAGALLQIGVFAIIVALNSVRHLTAEYLRKTLELRWRSSLTDRAIDMWTAGKAYWHLAQAGHGIDNPDQRIAEDCRLFVKGLLGEALDLISRVVGLFSYVAILWKLSDFPLSLAFMGLDMAIPHYMVWAAFLYVALSSGMTHLLGHPLKRLYVEQQHREADFRYAMARWRTAFDEVALTEGEQAEKRTFRGRFAAVADNWHRLIRRELILGSFTFPFQHTVLRIPLFVALPGYFAGHVAFGGLMQLSMAFSNVVTTLSWFIFSYRSLADLVSTSTRLDGFLQAAADVAAPHPPAPATDNVTQLRNVCVRTPEGRHLLRIGRLEISPGETVWLHGASGIGKTTLIKALAGFWPHREGEIAKGPGRWMFLPQKPFLPTATLLEAVAYPEPVDAFERTALEEALFHAGLDRRYSDKTQGLSGGEMQRLALARLLVHRPQWAVLDEATSALDLRAEAELLETLRRNLPDTALLVIAHRDPAALGKRRIVDLGVPEPLARTA